VAPAESHRGDLLFRLVPGNYEGGEGEAAWDVGQDSHGLRKSLDARGGRRLYSGEVGGCQDTRSEGIRKNLGDRLPASEYCDLPKITSQRR